MCNANGGVIIYGVAENSGQASQIKAIQSESPDAASRRFSQCIEAGIEPPIHGIELESIPIKSGGYVLVAHVPRSYTGPHRVTFKGKNIFYLRNQTRITQHTYSQLRAAFTLRTHAEERIRAWKAGRLLMIKADRTPRPVWGTSRYVLHLMPLSSFSENSTIDLATLTLNSRELRYGAQAPY